MVFHRTGNQTLLTTGTFFWIDQQLFPPYFHYAAFVKHNKIVCLHFDPLRVGRDCVLDLLHWRGATLKISLLSRQKTGALKKMV